MNKRELRLPSRILLAVAALLLIIFPTFLSAMTTTTTSTSNKMPTLKGVVFDMDDTLVRSNLDITAMYRKVFGKDPLNGDKFDILKEIDEIESSEEQARAHRIVDEMEEESRQQMTLMPGCVELLTWLSAHNIPTALVTRNSRKTTGIFCEKLERMQHQERGRGQKLALFKRIVTRDDNDDVHNPIPPKPDPTAIKIIARDCFDMTNDLPSSEILMVGDSVVNDVGFGRNAGVQTALLTDQANDAADMCVERLTDLPGKIWKKFEINGSLGNTEEANQVPLHGSPPPTPTTKLCKAVVDGDIIAVRTLLEELSLAETTKVDDENQNTALIWAAEIGNSELTSLVLEAVKAKLSNAEELSSFVNHRGFLGATAVNRAARRGHTHVLELLLSKNEKENAENKDDDNGAIKLFDVDLPNYKLQYPLHFAAFKKHPETLDYLLRRGADPWVLDRKGRTPFEDTSCESCKSLLEEAMMRSR